MRERAKRASAQNPHVFLFLRNVQLSQVVHNIPGGGGGGGTQIWFRRGCAAEAAKPVPIFKGNFGGKGYPLLGVLFKKITYLCTLARKWAKISSITVKLQKWGACLGIFRHKSLASKVNQVKQNPTFWPLSNELF